MKLAIFLFLLSLLFLPIDALSQQHQYDWQPIFSDKSKINKQYIDVTSVKTIKTDDMDFNTGIILIVLDDPLTTTIKNKPITVKSYTTIYLTDCKSGINIPTMSFVYNTDVITINTKPVAVVKYDLKDKKNIRQLKSNTPLYKSLCPTII